jgi:tripartite-type tricarboxylate transporter receptor subunit TctC
MSRHRRIDTTRNTAGSVAAAAIFALCAIPVAAQAQYPAKPIRIIVPFAASGPTDFNARLVAQRLNEAWGQSVLVENRPGAGGVTGTEFVARAAPDGYTLLGANPGPLTIAPHLRPKMGYDAATAFAPIVLVTTTTSATVVHPSLPVKSVKDLIALAQRFPGKLSYGSPGVGTVGHLTMELFDSMAGTKMTHVPYKGVAPAQVDLLSGNIQVLTISIPNALTYMKENRIRVLGVNGRARASSMPDIPTVEEAGLVGFESQNFNGIMAPAGTPSEIITRINTEVNQRVLSPEGRKYLIGAGYDIAGGTAESFGAFIKREYEKWGRVVRAADVKVEF